MLCSAQCSCTTHERTCIIPTQVPKRFLTAPRHWTAHAALLMDPCQLVREIAAVFMRTVAYSDQARRVVPFGPSLANAAYERALDGSGFVARARTAVMAIQRTVCAASAMERDAVLANVTLDTLGALAECLGMGAFILCNVYYALSWSLFSKTCICRDNVRECSLDIFLMHHFTPQTP